MNLLEPAPQDVAHGQIEGPAETGIPDRSDHGAHGPRQLRHAVRYVRSDSARAVADDRASVSLQRTAAPGMETVRPRDNDRHTCAPPRSRLSLGTRQRAGATSDRRAGPGADRPRGSGSPASRRARAGPTLAQNPVSSSATLGGVPERPEGIRAVVSCDRKHAASAAQGSAFCRVAQCG